ncbi:MAG: ketoacyl-ACP synthase III [Solirubrobacterales bacterium]|nr:ketoacyl-ACP synthase III [Solirubrobacterales bacterium]
MTSIREISVALADTVVTNADLARENPDWDMDRVARRTGVLSRRVAGPAETALDLSLTACEELFADPGAEIGPADVDLLLYCTQSNDYPMPGNAHVLHGLLGLARGAAAIDYNLGCSGYVYGLAIADALARAGLGSEILLVTSGTYTRYLNPRDRSTRSVFGDGAAVTRLSAADGAGGRIVAAELCSDGGALEKVYIPGGGARLPHDAPGARTESVDRSGNVRTPLDMQMDGPAVWSFALSVLPDHLRGFLAANDIGVADVDLFVFHQASRMVIDSLARALDLPRERVRLSLEDVGNLSAASIPHALRAALDDGAVTSGSRVVLGALGAGVSWGSVLVEYE